jgi:hypothetical protein
MLFAMAVERDMEIHQMDVVGAYLNGKLEDDIYMEQPEGFNDGSGRVWKMDRAIYGLKQAGRVWNTNLNQALIGLGFTPMAADPCVYIKTCSAQLVIISVYVDDMVIFADSAKLLGATKTAIASKFETADLGQVRHILGIEVTRDRSTQKLTLSQGAYTRSILEKYHMITSFPLDIPAEPNVKLAKAANDATITQAPYQSAIGALLYLAILTRPDISFVVQHLSQFNSKPTNAHWNAVKRVFRYLRGTIDDGITYSHTSNKLNVVAYSDANWASDITDRRSITGFVFLLCGGPVSWSSKKQPSVALSTMEAEYMALSSTGRHAAWVVTFLRAIGAEPTKPITIFADNAAANQLARNTVHHSRAKHIDIRYHFIREQITNRVIDITYTPSKINRADILTKALPGPAYKSLKEMLGIRR